MKNLITILFFLICCSVFGQTTLEEFYYITKGYKLEVESGRGIRQGYFFRDVEDFGLSYGSFQRKVTFKQLFRQGESTPCATLMILERTDTQYKEYLCIPHYKSKHEIWEMALYSFNSSVWEWTEASKGYTWGMITMISYMSSEIK